MKTLTKSFITGAFGLIALFLVLQHSGGFSKDVGSAGGALGGTFKVLQGR